MPCLGFPRRGWSWAEPLWAGTPRPPSLTLACPAPCGQDSPFSPAEFQKEAEPEGRRKGKFKTMKVLKLLGNKRDTKSKFPGDRS